MENFRIEKNFYVSELRNMLLSEGLTFDEYLNAIGESDEKIVRSPKNIAELNIAKKALEIFIELRIASQTEKFDPENNSAYTIGCLMIKGVSDREYMPYATELNKYMSSSEYLKGKYTFDKLIMPKGLLEGIIEMEIERTNVNPMKFANCLLYISSHLSSYNNLPKTKEEPKNETKKIKKGICSYVSKNVCVLTYLREKEESIQDKKTVKKYRLQNRIQG